jgi:hypothetical protein
LRAGSRVDRYLLFTIAAPLLAVIVLRGSWTHQGHTLARYVFPAQLAFLFWFAAGAMDLVRRTMPRATQVAEGVVAVILVIGYLALNPAIRQVHTLGPWYGHLYHHFDYVPEDNRALRYYDRWEVPAFYRKLGKIPPESVTIIQAPFDFAAPYNPDAFYAQFHRQHELQGFVHDLCLQDPRFYGEAPRDPRFQFRSFVYLDDAKAVASTGARYLVLQRDLRNGEPFKDADRCLEALRKRYGEPVEIDARVAVWDLMPR